MPFVAKAQRDTVFCGFVIIYPKSKSKEAQYRFIRLLGHFSVSMSISHSFLRTFSASTHATEHALLLVTSKSCTDKHIDNDVLTTVTSTPSVAFKFKCHIQMQIVVSINGYNSSTVTKPPLLPLPLPSRYNLNAQSN